MSVRRGSRKMNKLLVELVLILAVLVFCLMTVRGARRKGDHAVNKKPASHLVRPITYSPKDTWELFLKHAENEEKKAKEERKRLRQLHLRQMPPGIRGPRGPRGPPGPAGARITKKELIKEFREMVKEVIEKRFQVAIDTQCAEECIRVNFTNPLLSPVLDVDHVTVTSKVVRSFLWELKNGVVIKPNSIQELSNFHKPSARGSHDRCEEFGTQRTRDSYEYYCHGNSSNDGRYKIQKDGFYAFYISLHFRTSDSCQIDAQDSIDVQLCISSLCDEHISLRSISSLKSSPFTVSINGVLLLTKGEYVSLYVDNNSECFVNVTEKSQMSGILVGF